MLRACLSLQTMKIIIIFFSFFLIKISSESERRKATDIREIKDAYEKRLTQITKSAKSEIHRLVSFKKNLMNHNQLNIQCSIMNGICLYSFVWHSF